MKGKALAIVAAAFCAGLFVTVVPGVAPDVFAGPAEDSILVLPDIVAIEKFAAMLAPRAATVQRAIERRRHNGSQRRKIVGAKGWPYCDPACLRGGREADDALMVLTTNRPSVKSILAASISVNRTNKSDRLPQESLVKRNPSFSPSTETATYLPKRVPLGCDPAFSPIADPAHAHVYKRCVA